MLKSIFEVTKMDCPSEETMIRMKLQNLDTVAKLEFDIPNRLLVVYHQNGLDTIEERIHSLELGDTRLETEEVADLEFDEEDNQRNLLWVVLMINFVFFAIEMTTGLFSKSMGLIADSLDMLADAMVYGLSLMAVGSTLVRKKKIARIAGYFQITLAILGFIEVVRRFLGMEAIPNYWTMIYVSIFALIANAICLYLLLRSKSKEEAHMKASLIFTSNDVIINLGIIISAALVYWTQSKIPDLIAGSIVFILVMYGAKRILQLGR